MRAGQPPSFVNTRPAIWSIMASCASRLTNSRRALADFEEANRLARQRYEHGLSTYLDVLTAEEGVLEARLNVAQLETRAFSLDVQLIRALGGGFQAA